MKNLTDQEKVIFTIGFMSGRHKLDYSKSKAMKAAKEVLQALNQFDIEKGFRKNGIIKEGKWDALKQMKNGKNRKN
jgi:hypothetical protein